MRVARLTVPGAIHHVISRFVDRSWQLHDDAERGRYLELLGRALGNSDWRCLAYCLMSNHVHLAMVGGGHPFASWTKRTHAPFAHWLNARTGRLGPVFADRPSVYLIPPERALEVIAYIHNNPVRAGVVTTPAASTWSSHRAYLGHVTPPTWLDVAEGLARAGCDGDPSTFDRLVTGLSQVAGASVELRQVRAAARRHGAYEVATPTVGDRVEVPIVSRPHAARVVPPQLLIEAALVVLGSTSDRPLHARGRGEATSAKRVVVHAARVLGVAISDVAAALNLSRQRGAKLAQAELSGREAAQVAALVRLVDVTRAKVDKVDTVPLRGS